MPTAPPVLWLVRHAPTRENERGVLLGRRDAAATQEGLVRAGALLQDVAFTRAVSSDARRASATARRIAPGVPLETDARLRERSFGYWEGRAKAELAGTHPDAFTAGGALRLDADPPGGEPLPALLARVYDALEDLLARGGGDVLVVAHNGSLRAALVLLGVRDRAQAAAMSLDHLAPLRIERPRLQC